MESREFEQLEKLLINEAEKVTPPQSDLTAVLSRLPETVTAEKTVRYYYPGATKGRAPEQTINKLEQIMNNFWKVALPVGALVVVIAAVGYVKFINAPGMDNNLRQMKTAGESAAPVEFASAELNEAISELSDSAIGDDLLVEMEAEDAVYVDYDNEALSSYDNISLLYE